MAERPAAEQPAAPFLQVVRGDATPEEIAALVATLTAAAARARLAQDAQPPVRRTNWNARTRLLRTPVHPAPGGWRRSALP